MNQLELISLSLGKFQPELYLAALFIVLILADLVLKKKSSQVLPWLTLAALIPALILVVNQYCAFSAHYDSLACARTGANLYSEELFLGFLQLTQLSIFFKIILHFVRYYSNMVLVNFFLQKKFGGRGERRILFYIYCSVIGSQPDGDGF